MGSHHPIVKSLAVLQKRNAEIALQIFKGEKGAARDVAIANAACGLWVAGVANNLLEGAEAASKSIDSGAALQKLEELKNIYQPFYGSMKKTTGILNTILSQKQKEIIHAKERIFFW